MSNSETNNSLIRLESSQPVTGRDGFNSAFTWGNIGLQIGNGIISGAAAWGAGKLLEAIFDRGDQLEKLLEEFTDDVVRRMTINARAEINRAFSQENLKKLTVSTSSLSRKYEAYELTNDKNSLSSSTNHSFDAVEEARSLGVPAHGSFQVVSGIKMLLLREMANRDPSILAVICREVKTATKHVEDIHEILEILIAKAKASVGPWNMMYVTGEGDGEPSAAWFEISVDGIRKTFWIPAPSNSELVATRNRLETQLIDRLNSEILEPSRQILDRWNSASEQLCSSSS